MAVEQAQFETLLQNLLSSDNKTRLEAEETYESVPATTKIPFLIQTVINQSSQLEVRSLAAVLLRRVYSSNFEEFWPQLPPDAQLNLKTQMLLTVQQEHDSTLRKKVCECSAEFARNLLDDNGNNTWPDILKFLFDCASSSNVMLKESGLIIFSIVPGIFGNQQSQYISVIKQMLHQCITDQANQNVRFTATRAAVSFILANEDDNNTLAHMKDLLPFIIQCVVESINIDDDSLLKSLIDLAESTPKFLRPQLENIFNFVLTVLSDKNISDQLRQLALEVVVTLAESTPAVIRKQAKFVSLLIPQVLGMMVELGDDSLWMSSEDADDEDNESNSVAAESALDRLSVVLGGKTMLPHITTNLPPMLQSSDYQCRHAALMAISACGEGCHLQMESILENIVDAVLPFLQDVHPRVRYAACNATGQLSSDFGPGLQKKFHGKIVPALLAVMDRNYDIPRVQAHAGAALVNFSEVCPKNILTLYLDAIMVTLEQVLTAKFKELVEKGTKLVLEQVVTTLASVADTAEEKFEQYYNRFMPCLKYIVQNATDKELRMLRGKTIECISLVGLAVGREKFMQDCSDVMQLLLKTQTDWQDLPEDDPQLSYMISAWARICKLMGKEFEQYLPLVIGPVLKAAAIKPEVALLDSDDMKVMENDNEWHFVTLGDQQSFGIRTSGLEEKATACQMLVCYARELKEGFAEYTEQVVKIMVAHLKFYFHDGVRMAAAESLPYLLECARIRGPEYLSNMWQFICPELLKAVDAEPELDVKAEHLYAVSQCIEQMGVGCFTEEQMTELIQLLNKTLSDYFERQVARQEQRKDEDYDEVVEENLENENDQDVYLLSKVSDVMHSLFGHYKEATLSFFDQMLPNFVKLLSHERIWQERQWALCVFDDLLEFTGHLSMSYQQYFLQPMLQSLTDKQPEIRQAASFGIGIMAQFGGNGYAQVVAEALPVLTQVIQDSNSRSIENINATENAVSAVTKICKYNFSHINVAEVLPVWLSWLPVWEDDDEAIHIYGYLCDLVEINHLAILGENNQNLPKIMDIIATAFQHEAVPVKTDVGTRMVNIVRQLQSNAQIFQACIAHLTADKQGTLSAVLSS